MRSSWEILVPNNKIQLSPIKQKWVTETQRSMERVTVLLTIHGHPLKTSKKLTSQTVFHSATFIEFWWCLPSNLFKHVLYIYIYYMLLYCTFRVYTLDKQHKADCFCNVRPTFCQTPPEMQTPPTRLTNTSPRATRAGTGLTKPPD